MARIDISNIPGWVTVSSKSYSPAVREHILRMMQRIEAEHTAEHATHGEQRDRLCIECSRNGWADKKEHLDALFMLDVSAGDAIYRAFSGWHYAITSHLDGRHYNPVTSPVLGSAKIDCPLCDYWVQRLGPDISIRYADNFED